jgi:hypothetical protein
MNRSMNSSFGYRIGELFPGFHNSSYCTSDGCGSYWYPKRASYTYQTRKLAQYPDHLKSKNPLLIAQLAKAYNPGHLLYQPSSPI